MLVYAPYLGPCTYEPKLGFSKDLDLGAELGCTAAAAASPLQTSATKAAQAPSGRAKTTKGKTRPLRVSFPCFGASRCKAQELPSPATAAHSAQAASTKLNHTSSSTCTRSQPDLTPVDNDNFKVQDVEMSTFATTPSKDSTVVKAGNDMRAASARISTASNATSGKLAAATAPLSVPTSNACSSRWDRLNNYMAAQSACIEYSALAFGVGHGMLPYL